MCQIYVILDGWLHAHLLYMLPLRRTTTRSTGYLRAETLALTMKSSAPLPGIHCLITSRDSSLSSMLMESEMNPAASNWLRRVSISGAPDTQQAMASMVFRCAGITALALVTRNHITYGHTPTIGFEHTIHIS